MFREKERVATLHKARDDKNQEIESLKGRVVQAEGPARMKPSLFARLTRWLEQLAGLKKEEADILSKITEIEKRHAALRARGLLADRLRKKPLAPMMLDEAAPKPPPRIDGTVIFFFILGLLTGRKRPAPVSAYRALRND